MLAFRIRAAFAALCLFMCGSVAGAQAPATDLTSTVFRRFADQVIKIHVIETSSSAKAELGSGFFVTAAGHIITNFHVISKLVHEPTRYRAEWVEAGGATHPLTILAVDVVRDLAVLHADFKPAKFFVLSPIAEPQGTRLYALGHPNDLGLSIVEGTYNGLLQYTLYPKIHFTGALNPGMSGGPTITEDGRVIGVNVSTEGNEISFLVPVDRAAALLEKARAAGYVTPADELAEVGAQVRAYQDVYLDKLFGDSTPTVTLGPYKVPTRPASFFKCWADATRSTSERPYDVVSHQCSTDDYVFLSGDQSTGMVELRHRLFTSTGLNALRFYSLYEARFASGANEMEGSETDVTRFECQTRNVRTGTHAPSTMRAVMCVRRYKKLAGLYDVMLRVAVLGHTDSGLITTLTLAGVSFENAERITRRFLDRIQ
ncbi:MAG: serine protease [Gemmatimonadota bacterium]|nr:serine protease [Gemmatimonadota bacterium]